MQVFNSEHDFRKVKPGVFLAHENCFSDVLDKFPTREVLKQHVKVVVVLQCLKNVAAKVPGMELLENIPLVYDMLYLFSSSNIFFDKALHCKMELCPLILDELDCAEGSLAERLNDLEVGYLKLL